MNQPDLGIKVAELRQQKGLTQEQLAEKCEVSPRTIQRIENGEVDPRAYTLQCLGEALEFDFMEAGTSNENFWLVILHLSSSVPLLILPLLVWSWKKKQSYKINQQGPEVLSFQVTMMLLLLLGGFLLMVFPVLFFFIGETGNPAQDSSSVMLLATLCVPMPLILTGLFCTYQGAVNAIRALADKPIHYALSIPFVKS
jgi:transcriptional regulator with XRE-family HTH domain